MNKKFKRIFKRTLLTVFIMIAALVAIILFPQLLFANKMKYKKFKVCSNDTVSYDIGIVLDNDLLGIGPAARARLHNVIIKVRIDPKSNLAFPTFRKECEINLTYLLAHEMIHCLQAKKYGIMKFNPFRHPEFWKLEGYPEYISRKSWLSSKDYSLTSEIERYVSLENKATDIWILTGEGGCEFPDYYFKGRLMIEYLMDIKHLSYDQILKDSVSENTIFKEMIKWKDSTKKIEH